jgi:hypothetical protein
MLGALSHDVEELLRKSGEGDFLRVMAELVSLDADAKI